jgi:hypothetical protein
MKICLIAFVLLLAMPLRAQEAAKPGIEGQLLVEGKTIPFTHVYAYKHDNAEGIYDSAKIIKILLADSAVPPNTLHSVFRPMELVRQGKLHGILLEVDPAKSEGFSGRLLYEWKDKNIPAPSFTVLNHEEHRFTDFKFADGWVSGTVRMTKPDEHGSFEVDGKPVTYQYNATFRVKVEAPPPVTATLTGEKARSSPLVKPILAYHAAGKRGDMAAIRKIAPPEMLQRFEEMKKQMGEKEAMKMFREFWKNAPPTETLRKQITKIVVRGDRASVIVKEKDGTSWMTLVRQNGVWKLTDM